MSNTLTDMDRKEAIEIVRNIYQTDTEKEALATLIPELKESEDERIRDFLYEFIKVCAWSEKQFPPREKCLAYLEKHKEQKPAEWSEEEKRKHNRIYQILGWAADTHAYSMTCQLIGDKEAIELQDFLRSIAKPGDRLAEWSKEDEKILNELLDHCNTENATWYNFLKSLRPQPKKEWSDKEWSDEENINTLIDVIKAHYNDFPINARGLVDWLKSLLSRPKSSDNLPKWKKASAGTKLPSESVIRAEGQDPRFGSVAVYDCEYITINELEKLPKED